VLLKVTPDRSGPNAMIRLVAIIAPIAALTMIAAPAHADGGWTCGAWVQQHAVLVCKEKRTCTRRVCEVGPQLNACRTETRTECGSELSTKPRPPQMYSGTP
jgi:hypothetical protein